MAFLSVFLFLLGLFLGSFFLVIVDRIPLRKSFLLGRSACDHCHHLLAWYDLVPVMSFLWLQGRCRYCHTSLSRTYPTAELVTAGLFALTPSVLTQWELSRTAAVGSYGLFLVFLLFTVSVFIILFFSDLKYGIIPFTVVLPATFITGFFLLLVAPMVFLSHVLTALGAAALFFALYFFTKGRGMGFGDVVLVFYLGLLLGFPATGIALYLAFLTGAVVSLILVLSGQKKLRGGTVPFGPFLLLSAIVSLVWGDALRALVMTFFIR
jgi:leader peptidase (prepilin peptidase)/N-methyltransferase